MTKKIGLKETKQSNELTKNMLSIMHQNGADFTLTFRSLSSAIKLGAIIEVLSAITNRRDFVIELFI